MTANEPFAEYINGKSVAIVGRASYLRELNQGDAIDSHDIVVRVNLPVPYRLPKENGEEGEQVRYHHLNDNEHFVPSRYHVNIGSKTNIVYGLFSELGDRHIASVRDERLPLFLKAGGRFVCAVCRTFREGPAYYHSEQIYNLVRPYLREMEPVFARLDENRMARFNSGIYAIADILFHQPSRVYITGFTCFLDVEWIRREQKIPHHRPPLPQLNCLYALIENSDLTINVDDKMEGMFNTYVKR